MRGQGVAEHRESCRSDRGGGYVPSSTRVKHDLIRPEHYATVMGLCQSIPPAYTFHIGSQMLGADPLVPTGPILLDLFCGGGGAAMGYHRAGFRVIGVDLEPQPSYPFEFVRADALAFLGRMPEGVVAIHASPPCQSASYLTQGTNSHLEYPDLVEPTRRALEATGLPWVMENVPGARMRADLELCGEMFGLGVLRHRLFESNVPLVQPEHVPHRGLVRGWRHGVYQDGPYVAVHGDGGSRGTLLEWQEAMGIDWILLKPTLAQAIPPAYTELIGRQLMCHIG